MNFAGVCKTHGLKDNTVASKLLTGGPMLGDRLRQETIQTLGRLKP